jgi:hypothetical protein
MIRYCYLFSPLSVQKKWQSSWMINKNKTSESSLTCICTLNLTPVALRLSFSGLHRILVFLNLNWHLVEWLFSPVTSEVFYLCSEHNSCPYRCLSVPHHISNLHHNIIWQCKYSSCTIFGLGIFFIPMNYFIVTLYRLQAFAPASRIIKIVDKLSISFLFTSIQRWKATQVWPCHVDVATCNSVRVCFVNIKCQATKANK